LLGNNIKNEVKNNLSIIESLNNSMIFNYLSNKNISEFTDINNQQFRKEKQMAKEAQLCLKNIIVSL
jgi:hypothetical protein